MIIKKNVTRRQWIYGDFDKDKIKNIDDNYPLNEKRGEPNKFAKTVQLSNKDTKLSDVLLSVEKHAKIYEPHLKAFLKNNPAARGRVKSVASILNKAFQKQKNKIGDIAAVQFLTKDRKDATELNKTIRATMPVKHKYDNYYKHPRDKIYYAYHNDIKIPETFKNEKKRKINRTIEVQIKSKPMANLHEKWHYEYKNNPAALKTKKMIKMVRGVFKKGG